jgi:hypothetical protein
LQAQKCQLTGSFHTLRDGLHAETACHVDDGGHDCFIILIIGDVIDEELINFMPNVLIISNTEDFNLR